MSNIIVGTAGHIDHGKTALVKALTGIDADRLKEEKERGITIDIGFANITLPGGDTVAFIDVPGHERFIKNMLAGVGGIDLVMLVVAADESVMPQTREHLDICSLLHIPHGFTVLTKIDKVDSDLAAIAEDEVRNFLAGSFLENAPILRASSITGEGIPEVIELLRRFAVEARPRDASRIFRLPIDRCFTTKGFGTVVTGTLIAGRIQKGDDVEILPGGKVSRVRGVQVHGGKAATAAAGQRTALNLQDVEVAEIRRGMVATHPGTLAASSMFDCYLELLPSAPRGITIRKRIRFHAGTAELMGYAVLLDCERLEPGESAFAQIRLEEPVLALPGDRFIVRQYSPMITIGGGEILDALPKKHRRLDKRVIDSLRILKDGETPARLMVFMNETGLQTVDVPSLVRRSGLPEAVVDAACKKPDVRIVAENPRAVLASSAFNDATVRTLTELKRFHQANPLVLGISREELKNRALGERTPGSVFQAVLERLSSERKIVVAQDIIHEAGRTVTLGKDEEKMREALSDRFQSLGLQVPTPEEIIDGLQLDRIVAKKIVQLLVKENVLVRINDEIVIHRTVLDKLLADLQARKAANPELGVGDFKDLTGVTRKHAIPLLEYLDRQKLTRRMGDDRVIL